MTTNKLFEHVNNPATDPLSTEYIGGKRHYILPSGRKVPSVTTILDHFKGPELQQWRDRVGADVAKRITTQAARKGGALHAVLEGYLKNDPDFLNGAMPNVKKAFFNIRESVNRINRIHALEATLYSETLGIAGRTDVIGEFDEAMSIIDFKTSRKFKKEEWIISYFEQATAYALLYEEMFGVPIDQIVIVIITDERVPQVFIKDKKDYVESLKQKIETFHKEQATCF